MDAGAPDGIHASRLGGHDTGLRPETSGAGPCAIRRHKKEPAARNESEVRTARPLPVPPAGLEPAASAFGGRRPIHWATGAWLFCLPVCLTSSPRLKPGDSLHKPDSKGTSGLRK